MKLSVIQGPNLNMLGIREQHIYGPMSLKQIHDSMETYAKSNKIEVSFFQSNLEGEIIDKIQEALGVVDGIIINAAAFTHTSIAIKDALNAVSLPVSIYMLQIKNLKELFNVNKCTFSLHKITSRYLLENGAPELL